MASQQQLEAAAVLAQLTLLAVAISLGHLMKRKQVLWMGGAGAALLLGVFVGVLIRLAHTAPLVGRWMTFQSDFFFLVLLPPIMFDACFSLDSRLFVKNIGSVCALSFAGTTISTFAIGVNMWVGGRLRLCYALGIMEALTFGALISATDPVTVLSVFQALGAQPDLYMNVFGESVLNDAVAMVLFQTFNGFAVHEVVLSAGSVMKGVGAFLGIFLGSTALGIVLGLAAAALLKTRWYHIDTNLETGLMLLIGYGSYMAGTATGLSGIVCVMFCAMVAGGYAAPNLSPAGLSASKTVFAVLASCMEMFVFCYIGISLFMEPQEWHCIAFTVVCLFGLAWSRAANVIPCCAAINQLRPAELCISRKQQLVLWWSGLRGAMAFALSVEAMKSFPGETGKVMMTCTFLVILITVLVNGGSTGYLLNWCGLVEVQCSPDTAARAGAGSSGPVDDLEKASLLLSASCSVSAGDVQPDWRVAVLDDDEPAHMQQKGGRLAQCHAPDRSDSVEELNLLLQQRLQQRTQHQQHEPQSSSGIVNWQYRRETANETAAETLHAPETAAGLEVSLQRVPQLCSSSSCSIDNGHKGAAPANQFLWAHNGVAASSLPGQPSDGACKTPAAPAASRPRGLLEALRNNHNSLQDSLDGWGARVLQPWFINAESAAEHLTQSRQQQQQHAQQHDMSILQMQSQQASFKRSVHLHCNAASSLE